MLLGSWKNFGETREKGLVEFFKRKGTKIDECGTYTKSRQVRAARRKVERTQEMSRVILRRNKELGVSVREKSPETKENQRWLAKKWL